MADDARPWPGSPEGEELFADFLAQRAAGESVDLESLCAAHPERADELRALHARWSELGALLDDEPETLDPDADDDGGPRYRIDREIGRGGMGVVLRVWDEDLERTLAMKVVRGDGRGAARRRKRFLAEARVTGRLAHPGVPAVHELGADERGRAFFTMPLVDGRTLAEILDAHRADDAEWSRTRILGVMLKVCEAAAYAHDRRVIHRDLKPANVMVGGFGEVYVMDWGLARVLDEPEDATRPTDTDDDLSDGEQGELLTMEGEVVGTPAYMPPEQAAGRLAELGPQADVYALGAMLYQLLAGHPPYVDDDTLSSASAMLERVKETSPTPLTRVAPQAPPELVAIAEKAMMRTPAQRYPDLGALAEDLRAYLEGRVVRAYERGAWAELKKWIGRHRGLAAGVVLAVAATIAGFAGVAWVRTVERDKVLRLSDLQLLAEYKAAADELWPALPERIDDLDAWLGDARELSSRLPQHETRLAELEAASASAGPDGFANPESRWQLEKLDELVTGLKRLENRGGAIRSIEKRLEFASTIESRSIDEHEEAWSEAIDAIANDERFGGLTIEPQLGLVPLGPDPHSGFWEFAHLASGEPALRNAEGKLELQEESGFVFLLLPEGRYLVGAEPPGPAGSAGEPFVDPRAIDLEGPVHEVRLDAFFISKFEATRAQWTRMSGEDPSHILGASAESLLGPVEGVTWTEADTWLRRFDLTLPTEAQWEVAARGGIPLPRWCDWEGPTLMGFEHVGQYGGLPVGSMRPNPFGLFDVLGNVSEWCLDRFRSGYHDVERRPGNGEVLDADGVVRSFRGGSFGFGDPEVRVTVRFQAGPDDRMAVVGVRPARDLD